MRTLNKTTRYLLKSCSGQDRSRPPPPHIYTSPHTASSSSFFKQTRSEGYLYYSPRRSRPRPLTHMSLYRSSSNSFVEQQDGVQDIYIILLITYTSIYLHTPPQATSAVYAIRIHAASDLATHPCRHTYMREAIHTLVEYLCSLKRKTPPSGFWGKENDCC